jgi:hypothetical protein
MIYMLLAVAEHRACTVAVSVVETSSAALTAAAVARDDTIPTTTLRREVEDGGR